MADGESLLSSIQYWENLSLTDLFSDIAIFLNITLFLSLHHRLNGGERKFSFFFRIFEPGTKVKIFPSDFFFKGYDFTLF